MTNCNCGRCPELQSSFVDRYQSALLVPFFVDPCRLTFQHFSYGHLLFLNLGSHSSAKPVWGCCKWFSTNLHNHNLHGCYNQSTTLSKLHKHCKKFCNRYLGKKWNSTQIQTFRLPISNFFFYFWKVVMFVWLVFLIFSVILRIQEQFSEMVPNFLLSNSATIPSH